MRGEGIHDGILVILFAISLVACGGGEQNQILKYQTIEKGASSGIVLDAPQVFKIDNQAEWNNFWTRHKNRESPAPEQPAVDLAKYSIIAVVDREEPSSGFTMEIKSVTDQSATLRVEATRTVPGPACVVAAVVTEPFHIVQMDKSALQPVLILSSKTYDCSQ